MRNLACSQPSLHHICDIVGFGYLLVSAFWAKYFRKTLSSRITCLSDFKCNHDCNLEGFSSRCQQKGIKLNSQKLELKAKEVQFDSMVTRLPQRVLSQISKKGRRSSRCRVQGLDDILRFNGIVNYLSHFLSNLSDVMKPLRDVNHEDAVWYWNVFCLSYRIPSNRQSSSKFDFSVKVMIQMKSLM